MPSPAPELERALGIMHRLPGTRIDPVEAGIRLSRLSIPVNIVLLGARTDRKRKLPAPEIVTAASLSRMLTGS
jgi:hypothetical protein